MTQAKITVGILALQGAFMEHKLHLQKAIRHASPGSPLDTAKFEIIEVRTPEQLGSADALVIPGGESTAISLIAERTGLLEPLRQFVRVDRKPVWGTCAGLILLSDEASKAKKGGQELIGGLHVRCQRNHFGRQTESFVCNLPLPFVGDDEPPFSGVFIRAPIVEKVLTGADATADVAEGVVRAPNLDIDSYKYAQIEVISSLPPTQGSEAGDIVAVRQGNIFGTSFHPELTPDIRLHGWWLQECVLRRNELRR
ncbi:class I glutamine amidotransferase-like protein [Lipomyces chichibuensis]|uniref:class I glutamine amidotransferase-like protein n=1 Tax=Lipomyces chichibuensis TaxID=1546026 RepID=UPI00334329D6